MSLQLAKIMGRGTSGLNTESPIKYWILGNYAWDWVVLAPTAVAEHAWKEHQVEMSEMK